MEIASNFIPIKYSIQRSAKIYGNKTKKYKIHTSIYKQSNIKKIADTFTTKINSLQIFMHAQFPLNYHIYKNKFRNMKNIYIQKVKHFKFYFISSNKHIFKNRFSFHKYRKHPVRIGNHVYQNFICADIPNKSYVKKY